MHLAYLTDESAELTSSNEVKKLRPILVTVQIQKLKKKSFDCVRMVEMVNKSISELGY